MYGTYRNWAGCYAYTVSAGKLIVYKLMSLFCLLCVVNTIFTICSSVCVWLHPLLYMHSAIVRNVSILWKFVCFQMTWPKSLCLYEWLFPGILYFSVKSSFFSFWMLQHLCSLIYLLVVAGLDDGTVSKKISVFILVFVYNKCIIFIHLLDLKL